MKTWSIILGLLVILTAATIGYFRKHPSEYVGVKEKLAEKMSDEKPAPVARMSVAIASDSDPRGIYLSDQPATTARLLLEAHDNVSALQWSSDGRFLAFLTKQKSSDPNGEIRVFDTASSRDMAIASGAEFCWSTDARSILYTYQPEKAAAPAQFKIIDRETGVSRVLLDLSDKGMGTPAKPTSFSGLSGPGCSASSRYASIVVHGIVPSLYVAEIDKGLHTTIASTLGLWSPRVDEALVREPSKESDQENILAIVAPALSPDPQAPTMTLEEKSVVDPNVASAMWNPSGRAIYYLKSATSATGEKAVGYDLMKYERNSGIKRPIKQGMAAAWNLLEASPDEKRLLVVRPASTAISDVESYYSLDLETKTLQELRLRIGGVGKILLASWRPRAGG